MAQRAKKDIYLYQGDDKGYQFTLTSGGAVYSVDGASSVEMHVKQLITDVAILFSAAATDGNDGNDWDAGIVVITISDTQSALLAAAGVYELEVIDTTTTTVCYGDVLLQKQVGTATP